MTERTTEAPRGRTDPGGWIATGAGVAGALAMTSCCILPLALVSLGVGGVFIGQLGALYAWKWATFAFAAAALGYGFWSAYRPASDAACRDGTCARPLGRTAMRALLWIATAVVLLALAFPLLAPIILRF
ncbi:mercuric transporter MerT family protein [Jannaschia sp. W003]|uniref:mercuric transporter MerT family protein n=1 Tax=Jannaschia sp. W003 TaxID=2867012 RepID=UPI0021A621D1|nr:mercuric transporter MerT family protein [Jannaschia sp. W003]UWQ20091.1 mercury transporter [Jannaschia sp. W003]